MREQDKKRGINTMGGGDPGGPTGSSFPLVHRRHQPGKGGQGETDG